MTRILPVLSPRVQYIASRSHTVQFDMSCTVQRRFLLFVRMWKTLYKGYSLWKLYKEEIVWKVLYEFRIRFRGIPDPSESNVPDWWRRSFPAHTVTCGKLCMRKCKACKLAVCLGSMEVELLCTSYKCIVIHCLCLCCTSWGESHAHCFGFEVFKCPRTV